MAIVQERYRCVLLGVNATHFPRSQSLGFFIASTAGTLTIVNNAGFTIVIVPVTAGVYLPLPIFLGSEGDKGAVVLSGGASGTIGG
jgi:hypothetical protein